MQRSLQLPGNTAKHTEEGKMAKYSDLQNAHIFTHLGFETVGHWGPATVKFI